MGYITNHFTKGRGLGLYALAAFAMGTTALAEEQLVLPTDTDPYLHSGPVNAVEELDAIRRHVKDLKSCVIFGVGFIGTAIFLHRIL